MSIQPHPSNMSLEIVSFESEIKSKASHKQSREIWSKDRRRILQHVLNGFPEISAAYSQRVLYSPRQRKKALAFHSPSARPLSKAAAQAEEQRGWEILEVRFSKHIPARDLRELILRLRRFFDINCADYPLAFLFIRRCARTKEWQCLSSPPEISCSWKHYPKGDRLCLYSAAKGLQL